MSDYTVGEVRKSIQQIEEETNVSWWDEFRTLNLRDEDVSVQVVVSEPPFYIIKVGDQLFRKWAYTGKHGPEWDFDFFEVLPKEVVKTEYVRKL